MQDSVYDKFIDLLVEKVKSTPIGDGFDDTVTAGPIVSERIAEIHSMMCGCLIRRFDRSRKLSSIRCGVTSSPENRKVPKYWWGEKGVRVKAISWIPQVRAPVLNLISEAWIKALIHPA